MSLQTWNGNASVNSNDGTRFCDPIYGLHTLWNCSSTPRRQSERVLLSKSKVYKTVGANASREARVTRERRWPINPNRQVALSRIDPKTRNVKGNWPNPDSISFIWSDKHMWTCVILLGIRADLKPFNRNFYQCSFGDWLLLILGFSFSSTEFFRPFSQNGDEIRMKLHKICNMTCFSPIGRYVSTRSTLVSIHRRLYLGDNWTDPSETWLSRQQTTLLGDTCILWYNHMYMDVCYPNGVCTITVEPYDRSSSKLAGYYTVVWGWRLWKVKGQGHGS